MESRFYFGDLATTPHGDTGEVAGIWKRDGKWKYRLDGIERCCATWWSEDQLKRPSEAPEAKPFTEVELIEAWEDEPGLFNRLDEAPEGWKY